MSTKPPPMRNLRTLVPPAVFTELEAQAALSGVTLAAYVRSVLTDHVSGNPAASRDVDEWAGVLSWLEAHSLTVTRVKENLGFTTKREVADWAHAHPDWKK